MLIAIVIVYCTFHFFTDSDFPTIIAPGSESQRSFARNSLPSVPELFTRTFLPALAGAGHQGDIFTPELALASTLSRCSTLLVLALP